MIEPANIARTRIGVSQFIDRKNKIHTVIHSRVILSPREESDRAERIAAELHRIFAGEHPL